MTPNKHSSAPLQRLVSLLASISNHQAILAGSLTRPSFILLSLVLFESRCCPRHQLASLSEVSEWRREKRCRVKMAVRLLQPPLTPQTHTSAGVEVGAGGKENDASCMSTIVSWTGDDRKRRRSVQEWMRCCDAQKTEGHCLFFLLFVFLSNRTRIVVVSNFSSSSLDLALHARPQLVHVRFRVLQLFA